MPECLKKIKKGECAKRFGRLIFVTIRKSGGLKGSNFTDFLRPVATNPTLGKGLRHTCFHFADTTLTPYSDIPGIAFVTSNVTGRHRGPKRKRTFVCRYVAPPGECYYNTVLRCAYYLSSSSVVSSAFFALCVYSTYTDIILIL